MVGFTNEKDGSITHIQIARSLSKAADQEALRVVKLYPRWEPSLSDGKPVSSQLTIPVTFK